MSRIPAATRESVPQDQLAAFDEMVSQRGSVPDIGPISVMINVPGTRQTWRTLPGLHQGRRVQPSAKRA